MIWTYFSDTWRTWTQSSGFKDSPAPDRVLESGIGVENRIWKRSYPFTVLEIRRICRQLRWGRFQSLKVSFWMPYFTISLLNWRELMSASSAARLTLPLVRANTSLRYWRSKSSMARLRASASGRWLRSVSRLAHLRFRIARKGDLRVSRHWSFPEYRPVPSNFPVHSTNLFEHLPQSASRDSMISRHSGFQNWSLK